MYFSLMRGRVMLTCDSFALVGSTSTPKGGFGSEYTRTLSEGAIKEQKDFFQHKCARKRDYPFNGGLKRVTNYGQPQERTNVYTKLTNLAYELVYWGFELKFLVVSSEIVANLNLVEKLRKRYY